MLSGQATPDAEALHVFKSVTPHASVKRHNAWLYSQGGLVV